MSVPVKSKQQETVGWGGVAWHGQGHIWSLALCLVLLSLCHKHNPELLFLGAVITESSVLATVK